MNIIGGEFEDMQKTKGFLKKIYTLILLIALILCLSFSIRTGYCGELQNNKALDEKVRMFLENRKGTWHDWNIPYSDGKVLYDLVLKNKYKKAIDIGTSTGLSAIWIAWALSKMEWISVKLDN
jgi:caffeoyl-CoA O-methyltransferase